MSLVVSDAEVKNGLVIQILRRPTKAGCGEDHGGLIGLEDPKRGIPDTPPSEKWAACA